MAVVAAGQAGKETALTVAVGVEVAVATGSTAAVAVSGHEGLGL